MKTTMFKTLLVSAPLFGFGKRTKDSPYTDPSRLAALVEGREKPEAAPYLLVDVRTPGEYAGGHIPTASNVPVDLIGDRPPTERKDALIILYCRSGARSATAQRILESMGYTDVADFGGVHRWAGEIVRGTRPTA